MNHPLADVGWALTRFVFGASLAWFHGYGKVFEGKVYGVARTVGEMGFPFPLFSAWVASLTEFFGGLFVALGFLTRPAAGMCAAVMLVALFRHRNDPFQRMEMALMYLSVMVLALLVGGGHIALDRMLGIRNPFVRKNSLGV